MGRRQTEIYYQSEAAYLKSVLLWLQEYWTGPAPRFYPLNQVEQGGEHSSAQRPQATSNRRDAIVDLPAFLPPQDAAARWRRANPNLEGEGNCPAGGSVGKMHGISRPITGA
jgi:hypothetical protein